MNISTEDYILTKKQNDNHQTIIDVNGTIIGGNNIVAIAGPCAVENNDTIYKIAEQVKQAGATILRGGAFKPRTSPYQFQGLKLEGLRLLRDASTSNNLLVVTELLDVYDLEDVYEYSDIIQIGARNMQNFPILKEVGKLNKPVILKRGLSATIHEFLFAAEYIMQAGNSNVILCERGIRTFEPFTRNTLDISAVPLLQQLTHLPVIVDPSHGCGLSELVPSLCKASVAVGSDGIMVEVHTNPSDAISDKEQTISTKDFTTLMNELKPIANAIGRTI